MENVIVPTKRELATQQRYQQRYRCAVVTLMRYKAKDKVKEQLRAKGQKLQHFSCKELSLMAEDYLAAHRDELILQAAAMAQQILRARWR